MSDAVFHLPSNRLLDAHAAAAADGTRTHGYRFTWPSSAFDGRLRSAHIVEIPFVWDNLHKGGVEFLLGGPGPQPLADAMHESWGRFARGDDPGHGGTGAWPNHDAARRPTMGFDLDCGATDDPAAEDRLAWEAT